MGQENRSKLNQLFNKYNQNAVLTATDLHAKGFNYDLIHKYKVSNWLTQIDRGAYIFTGKDVDWKGALYSLQNQLQLPVYVGGKTVLQMKGFSHYLVNNLKQIYLFGCQGTKLPHWFNYFKSRFEIVFTTTNLFPKNLINSFSTYNLQDLSIKISSPERAAFELAYHIPQKISFKEALLIFENLTTFRPQLVQELLETCSSIKVKRLFLFMAGKNQLPWLNKLNLKKLNLGKGKRMVEKNGILDKKYNITVPRQI